MLGTILAIYAFCAFIYFIVRSLKNTPAILRGIIVVLTFVVICPFAPVVTTYGQFKKGNKKMGYLLAFLALLTYALIALVAILEYST